MLKNYLEDILNIIRSRIFILGALFSVFFIVLIVRLYDLQIVSGEQYLDTFTYRIQKNVQLPAPRGTIYDCNGIPLAYNKLCYRVTIEDSTGLSGNEEKNSMISDLIDFIEAGGDELIYDIPIEKSDGAGLVFSAQNAAIVRFKKDIYSTQELDDKQKEATAADVYDYLCSDRMFGIDTEAFGLERSLKILSVRYDIFMKRYEKYLSVTVVNNASDKLVAAIKENQDKLPGISIEQGYTREYADSKYFSAVTGYIGNISEDELAAFKEQGDSPYSQNDQIGKIGIESYYEDKLRGTKGSQTLYVNNLGSVLETADTISPQPGQDVYLSIDSEYTKRAYDMVEERIAGILLAYMRSGVDRSDNEELFIPANDFYYALIKNNIIDLNHLDEDDASYYEKNFRQKFIDYQTNVSNTIAEAISKKRSSLKREERSYIDMSYNMLVDDGVLRLDKLDSEDEKLTTWRNREMSLYNFLYYAIGKGLVDLSYLDLSSDYLSSDEIYESIVRYLNDYLPQYNDFEKEAYYYMLENGEISGEEICILLYEQGVLEKDSDYERLASGSLTAYDFMYSKIYYMQITPDMLALYPCSCAYIVTDTGTGKAKALVSYPSYDANRMNETAYYSSLLSNQSLPLYNRVTQQALAPGSTYKLISTAAALEEKVVTTDTYITDHIEFKKVVPSASCWNKAGHGDINIEDAIMFSCNYYFYEMGYRLATTEEKKFSETLGLSRLAKYAQMFGLDSISGIELTETKPKISDDSAVRSAIGQGTNNYTAAQLSRYVNALANNGTLYKLSVIDKICDNSGKVTDKCEPVVDKEIKLEKKTWDVIHNGMYKVCNVSDYSRKMAGLGITMAGKSGTAEESEEKPSHALFVGYAPYKDPKVSSVLIIPNGYGSSKVLDLYADLTCAYFNVPVPVRNDSNEVIALVSDDDEQESSSRQEGVRTANIPDISTRSD